MDFIRKSMKLVIPALRLSCIKTFWGPEAEPLQQMFRRWTNLLFPLFFRLISFTLYDKVYGKKYTWYKYTWYRP